MSCLRTWFSGGVGSAGLTVGLDDLRALFQPKCSYAKCSRVSTDLRKQIFQAWRSAIEMTTNCFYPNTVFSNQCFPFILEDGGVNIFHVVQSLVSCQLQACWIMSTHTVMLSRGQILATMARPAHIGNTTETEGGKGRRTRWAEQRFCFT